MGAFDFGARRRHFGGPERNRAPCAAAKLRESIERHEVDRSYQL
jgi:hypothetical protein